jgi:hypothetical protein
MMKRLPLILALLCCALLSPLAFVPTEAQVGVPITPAPYISAPANYSGWYRVAGSGTNAATAIQAALDAAYAQRTPAADEYTYLDSSAGVVTLPPGKKIYIAGSGTDPALIIPQGVTLDLNGSTLFVAPPASATNQWCGVVLKHGAKLRNGRIYGTADAVWPGYASADYRLTYDGVRIFESDGDACVEKVEIKNFRGAAIRVIGSWNTDIQNCRFLSCSYGIVLSKLGDAFSATAYTRRRASTDDRCTSTYVRGCRFTNIPLIGLLAAASGESGDAHINADDFSAHTTMLHVEDCYFENVSSFAIRCLASWPKITNTTFEECGNVNGVIEFSVCKAPVLSGCEYIRDGSASNLVRHSNTAINDTVTPNPGAFVRATQSNVVSIHGLTTNISSGGGTMTFVRTATNTGLVASGVAHIGTFGFPGTDGDITTAPVADGLYLSGTYNGPHVVTGTVHHWNNAGTPTWKNGVPSSISDGTPY